MDWNAKGYAECFGFVPRYGEELLGLLDARPGESVIDLGCGDGTLTAQIAGTGAGVVGIDASAAMLEQARRKHPGIEFMQQDAAVFSVREPADKIFSNAVFHWIADQEALLSHVSAALKPGGTLVFEMGGKGNVETIHSTLRDIFEKYGLVYRSPHFFPSVGEYAPMLERHGLQVVYALFFSRDTLLRGENGLEDWIRMFLPSPFAGMEAAKVSRIIEEAVSRMRPLLWRGGAGMPIMSGSG